MKPDTVLEFTRWVELDQLPNGEPFDSLYADTFWLPVLGPTAMALGRHLARRLRDGDGGYVVEAVRLGGCLGLGKRSADHIASVLGRLSSFRFALVQPSGTRWLVRTTVPPVADHIAAKYLPDDLRAAHEVLVPSEARR